MYKMLRVKGPREAVYIPKCILLGLFTGFDVLGASCYNTKSLSAVLTIIYEKSLTQLYTMFKTEIS